MQKTVLAAASVAGAFVCVLSSAQAGTLIPIVPIAGSTSTTVTGINDNNLITGGYRTADQHDHGYVGTLDGTYTTFDYGYGFTYPRAINNDGYITGYAADDALQINAVFMRRPDGTILNVMSAPRKGTALSGDAGQIIKHQRFVGTRYTDTANIGFYGRGTSYRSDIVLPFHTTSARPRGYNKNGDVVGSFVDVDNGNKQTGFILRNGVATAVAAPDSRAFYMSLSGINDRGKIVGSWQTQDTTTGQAFFFDPDTQLFTIIDLPGSKEAGTARINNAGLVAINADTGSFIYCSHKKSCPTAGVHAIEVSERTIHALPGTVRSVVCQHGCVGPWRMSPMPSAHAVLAHVLRDWIPKAVCRSGTNGPICRERPRRQSICCCRSGARRIRDVQLVSPNTVTVL
jgi:hypothetical protein